MKSLGPRLMRAAGSSWLLLVVSAALPAEGPPSGPGNAAAEAEPADALWLQQQQIAQRFEHLDVVLQRIAELTEATDPRRAALLKKARQQSKDQLIDVQFEALVLLLQKDQLSRAIENQEDLMGDLQALLKLLLSEDRAKRIESERTRIREYLRRVNQLIRGQKGLQGRVAGSRSPENLSGEQGNLADQAGELAQDIRENEEGASATDGQGERQGQEGGEGQDGGEGQAGGEGQDGGEGQSGGQQGSGQQQDQNPARQRLDAARQRMIEAQQQLEEAQREGAVERQEEAIRELQQAKAELEEILRQLREEEIMRMLAMLEARFRKMLDIQREVYDGTVRLDKVPESQRSHNHEIEASRLSGLETQIIIECDKVLLVLAEDGTAVAFPEAVEQAREDMRQVELRLAQVQVGQITQEIEEDIIAALEEMIDALKKAQKEMEDGRPGRQSSGAPSDPALIDMLAELKMIRALQMRVNRRTQRYSKLIQGEQADNAELIEAIRELAQREERIRRVTRDLEMGINR
jgi:hypothetical protein